MSPAEIPANDQLWNRRAFARAISLGAVGVAFSSISAKAADVSSEKEAPIERPLSEVDLRLATIILACPGDHWTEDAILAVLRDLQSDAIRSQILIRSELENRDEPATIFSVLPFSMEPS